jgi:hypothetical protein
LVVLVVLEHQVKAMQVVQSQVVAMAQEVDAVVVELVLLAVMWLVTASTQAMSMALLVAQDFPLLLQVLR